MTQEALSRWDSSGQSTLSPWVADVRADPSQTSLQVSSHVRTCFSGAGVLTGAKVQGEEALEITMLGGYWGTFHPGEDVGYVNPSI